MNDKDKIELAIQFWLFCFMLWDNYQLKKQAEYWENLYWKEVLK